MDEDNNEENKQKTVTCPGCKKLEINSTDFEKHVFSCPRI